MEITPKVKDYVERKIDLFDENPYEFIRLGLFERNYTKDDIDCFIDDVLVTLNMKDTVNSEISKYLRNIEAECKKINDKYELSGVTCGLFADPYTIITKLEDIQRTPVFLEICPYDNGSLPSYIPSKYRVILNTHGAYYTTVMLTDDKNYSASYDLINCKKSLTFEDIHNEDYFDLFTKYDAFCKGFSYALKDCLTSLDNQEVLRNQYIPKVSNEMRDYLQPQYGTVVITYHRTHNNSYLIKPTELQKETNSDLAIDLPYDQDPSTIDLDGLLTDWKKRIDKFNKRQAALKKKDDEREAERILSGKRFKPPTKRDIVNAIKAIGATPSSVSYTNKYKDTTTYKFQFMNLSEHDCYLIKDELLQNNIDVVSVDTRVSQSSRGPYNSLFVVVRNQ